MENILKKIAEFDKVRETKLAKHEVELGAIDDVKNEVIAINKLFDSYDSNYEQLKTKLIELGNNYRKSVDAYMNWFGKYNKVEEQILQLGLKVPEDVSKLEKIAIEKSNVGRDLSNYLKSALK